MRCFYDETIDFLLNDLTAPSTPFFYFCPFAYDTCLTSEMTIEAFQLFHRIRSLSVDKITDMNTISSFRLPDPCSYAKSNGDNLTHLNLLPL